MGVRTKIELSTLRILRAARAARERRATQKLALLRRMERQQIFHELTEKRVEQSFNEQLFAVVFDYQTLLSHNPGEFHLLPQNFSGKNRFDDFSLGFFGRPEAQALVLASAEFKSPGCDLDKPQTSGQYGGTTPVQQAIVAAKAHSTCRWALVSNFCELRLYSLDPEEEVARANLLAIRTQQDLADLCAHFDRIALIGDGRKELPEMTIALADDHPVRAFDRQPRFYRVQWLFTPNGDRQLALHEIERQLRFAVARTPHAGAFFPVDTYDNDAPLFQIKIRSGWVVVEGKSSRLAETRLGVSRYGQVALSLSEPVGTNIAQTYQEVEPHFLNLGAILFGRLVLLVTGSQHAGVGTMEVSLSDLHDDSKPFVWARTMKGVADDVVDARWDLCDPKSANDVATAIGRCLCELAIYFRDANGGEMLDLDAEVKLLEPYLT